VDRRIQVGCAWSGLVGGTLIGLGLIVVAGIVPAPSAANNASQIAGFYRSNASSIKVGLLLAMVGASLLFPFLALILVQLKRSDPRLAPLAYTQFIAGGIFMAAFLIPVLLWGTAAFRPDRPAASTQLLNDAGSTIFYWAFAPGTVECAAMGIAVLLDRSEHPIFPRWVGYIDLFAAVAYAGGAPAVFVKTGAFGWDGVFALWLPLVGFSAWLWATFTCSIRPGGRPPDPAVAPASV
jgi:hypothetical protein